ncbi:MAG: ABC transporter permease, partial [Acidimicrobiia bacterium]
MAGVAVPGKLNTAVRETGNMFAIALEGLRRTWRVWEWWPEYLRQCWFIAKVTSIPVMLVSIPFGAVIALQVGSFNRQLGAESATGAAMVLVFNVVVQGVTPGAYFQGFTALVLLHRARGQLRQHP